MKRGLFILIAVILAVNAVAELELEEVYNDEVKDQDEFEVEGKTYTVLPLDTERAKIKFPDTSSQIMSPGDCETVLGYHLCVINISEGPDEEFDIANQRYPLYTKITVSKLDAALEFTRDFENTTLVTGESTKVDIAVTNNGNAPITGIIFNDSYPQNFLITECAGCTTSGNLVTWQGNLGVDKTYHFSYTLKAIAEGDFDSTAYVTFNNEVVSSDTETIEAQKTLVLINSSFPEKLELGKKAITNTQLLLNGTEHPITNLKYRVFFPDGIKKARRAGDISSFGDHWLHTQSSGIQGANLSFEIEAQKLGNFTIREELEYTINNALFKTENTYTIQISTQKLKVGLDHEESYTAGDDVTIPLSLKNLNPAVTFRNININIESDLPEINSQSLTEEIGPLDLLYPTELSFTLPTEEKDYTITITVTYSSPSGETLSQKEVITISAKNKQQTDQSNTEQADSNTGLEQEPSIDGNDLNPVQAALDSLIKAGSQYAVISLITLIICIPFVIFILRKNKQKNLEDRLKESKER